MSIHVEAVYEQGVFRPLTRLSLADGQHVSLDVVPTRHHDAGKLTELPEWCKVFDGMTDEEFAELEKIILDRSNFMRPPLVDDE